MWFKERGRFNAFMRWLTWPRNALAFRSAVDDLIEAYRLDADKGASDEK